MAIKYIPFTPEPIEGQAVLNFSRMLKYKGADEVKNSLLRGMPLYETEKQETVGENKDGNLVIRGECISACAYLRERNIKVDLVYIDPPFASGADYAKKIYIRRNPKVAKAIAKAEEELEDDDFREFEEKMYGDVWDKEKYLNWMYENLMAIKSVMSETASIYVHLDWHIGHYVKILMDEIFGEDNFRNEIIWCYTGPGSPNMKQFNRKHDTIFWYTKSADYLFCDDNIRIAHDEKTIENFKHGLEGSGFTSENYDLDAEGKIPEDWWQFAIAGRFPVDGKKRVDYATEKPWALLDRIIQTSSDEGMLVADFFGGSGVAAAVASKLGRKFITSDININSIQTTRDRLRANGAEFDVLEVKDGVSLCRNPIQTMEKIKSIIPGLQNDGTLDPKWWRGAIFDSKLGKVPIYTPDLKDRPLLDEALMHRIIHEAIPELDDSVKKVIVYYIDIDDRKKIDQMIHDNDSTLVKIELLDLKKLLDAFVVQDEIEFSCKEVDGKYCLTFEKFVSDRVSQKIDKLNQNGFANAIGKKTFNPITISEEGLELIELISVDCTVGEGIWHSDYEIKIDKNGYLIANGTKTKTFWDGTMAVEKKPLRLKVRNICGDESEVKVK